MGAKGMKGVKVLCPEANLKPSINDDEQQYPSFHHSPHPLSSLIFLNKKPGITSFDALRDIKKQLGTNKVGHTGTLDKFAQGLLIVLIGKALRLTKYFIHCDKQYVGKICFGKETDTLDPEGEVIAEAPLPEREQVESVLSRFTGSIMQAPPVYSALHIDGKRASELARAGNAPEMKTRPVTIYKLELRSWNPPFAEIFVHCSSGTYIRSLARDIALAANSRGHLVELLRTSVGGFSLEMEDEGKREKGKGEREELAVRNINKDVIAKLGLPIIDISVEEAQYIKHGKPLNSLCVLCDASKKHSLCSLRLNSSFLSLFCNEELVAIIEKDEKNWKYGVVFV